LRIGAVFSQRLNCGAFCADGLEAPDGNAAYSDEVSRLNPSSRSRNKNRSYVVALVLLTALLATSSPAQADHYTTEKAGHPLRIAAYVLHPFGVMVDVLILRPAHWVGSRNGLNTLFGHTAE